jgi:hypothetical protein
MERLACEQPHITAGSGNFFSEAGAPSDPTPPCGQTGGVFARAKRLGNCNAASSAGMYTGKEISFRRIVTFSCNCRRRSRVIPKREPVSSNVIAGEPCQPRRSVNADNLSPSKRESARRKSSVAGMFFSKSTTPAAAPDGSNSGIDAQARIRCCRCAPPIKLSGFDQDQSERLEAAVNWYCGGKIGEDGSESSRGGDLLTRQTILP